MVPRCEAKATVNPEDIKELAKAIAKKPLHERQKLIYQILKDLDKHIQKENNKKITSYVV